MLTDTDRELAADFAWAEGDVGTQRLRHDIRTGKRDDHWIVQRIVRHRTASTAGLTAEIQRLREDCDRALAKQVVWRARAEQAEEALAWYGEQARLARLVHSGGDAGRHALAEDGGKRARAALFTPSEVSEPVADESGGEGEPSKCARDAASRIIADFRPNGWPAKEAEIARFLDRWFATPPNPTNGDAVREALGWQPIETCPMWEVAFVTDGENVAKAQKAEADYGGFYWAVEPEDCLEWEPAHWIGEPATLAKHVGAEG